MKTKLETAIETVKGFVSEIPQGRRVSKLETPSGTGNALSTLGIKNSAPEMYEIIDAYNARMMELSPLNRDLYDSTETTPSASELDVHRKGVRKAYELLANNYKSLPVVESLPEQTGTNLVAVNNDGVSTYDAYLGAFNRLHERINSVTLEDVVRKKKKYAPFADHILYDWYFNPPIKEMIDYKKRGFSKQELMPIGYNAQWDNGKKVFDHLSDFYDDIVVRCLELDNEHFDYVHYYSGNPFSEEAIVKDDICGILKETESLHDTRVYLIGKKLIGPIAKTIKELKGEANPLIYKKVFGFESPKYKDMEKFLKRIHKIKGSDYEWRSVSREQLKYPLTEEVFEIYCAAEDSDLFKQKGNELEFLVLGKVDPILNGKILGGLNLPICWWV
ncbi:MAG: hypothetical protein KKF67_03585 [Nanoarchaeota archaeon]|nr:hypothetical protein [Nanoarchaeota archaeon]